MFLEKFKNLTQKGNQSYKIYSTQNHMFSLKINTYTTQDLCEYGVSTAFMQAIMSSGFMPLPLAQVRKW
jgi:hypothetical protein